jgi:hypothetical protein
VAEWVQRRDLGETEEWLLDMSLTDGVPDRIAA